MEKAYDDRRLRDLLAPELSWSVQIASVVVAQVVIRSNRDGLNTSIDEELGKNRLDLCLA